MKNSKLLYEIAKFCKYVEEQGIKIRPLPKLSFSDDNSYVNEIFGRTAWYSPDLNEITLITEGRHPKDILRSFAHELVHHNQRIRGDMDEKNTESLKDPNYTQNDKHLRKMEAEAYMKGNMLLRDFEDKRKKE